MVEMKERHMLKGQTHFEQVPVKVVLKIAKVEPQIKVQPENAKQAGRQSARTTRKNRVSHD
jgi:hypothetical protein